MSCIQSRQPQVTSVIRLPVGCLYFLSGLRFPSQLQAVARMAGTHVCCLINRGTSVNDLPKADMWCRMAIDWTCELSFIVLLTVLPHYLGCGYSPSVRMQQCSKTVCFADIYFSPCVAILRNTNAVLLLLLLIMLFAVQKLPGADGGVALV